MAVPQWGDKKYADNEPVPIRSYKCRSTAIAGSAQHVCKRGIDHDGLHKCVCGKSWKNTAAAA